MNIMLIVKLVTSLKLADEKSKPDTLIKHVNIVYTPETKDFKIIYELVL